MHVTELFTDLKTRLQSSISDPPTRLWSRRHGIFTCANLTLPTCCLALACFSTWVLVLQRHGQWQMSLLLELVIEVVLIGYCTYWLIDWLIKYYSTVTASSFFLFLTFLVDYCRPPQLVRVMKGTCLKVWRKIITWTVCSFPFLINHREVLDTSIQKDALARKKQPG